MLAGLEAAKARRTENIAAATVLAPAAPRLPARGQLVVGARWGILSKARGDQRVAANNRRLTRTTEPPNAQARVIEMPIRV
jgi:hypothetical protein